jgi:hypothetical protein
MSNERGESGRQEKREGEEEGEGEVGQKRIIKERTRRKMMMITITMKRG